MRRLLQRWECLDADRGKLRPLLTSRPRWRGRSFHPHPPGTHRLRDPNHRPRHAPPRRRQARQRSWAAPKQSGSPDFAEGRLDHKAAHASAHGWLGGQGHRIGRRVLTGVAVGVGHEAYSWLSQRAPNAPALLATMRLRTSLP